VNRVKAGRGLDLLFPKGPTGKAVVPFMLRKPLLVEAALLNVLTLVAATSQTKL